MAAALAATSVAGAADAAPVKTTAAAHPSRPSRATVRIDAGAAKPWVGQRIPITVTALFRDVESVTIEGQPQITSTATVTSELTPDPKQATQIVDGTPMLVVRWTASVTPQTAGPLDLSVSIPVKLRYREAAPARERAERWSDQDPFSGFGMDEDFDAVFDRLRRRMHEDMQAAVGPAHEQTMTLTASLPRAAVRALPKDGRPASFTGAVGTLDISASTSATSSRASDPITVRYVVDGDADLDRVELAGVPASDAWKVYPPRVVPDAGAGARKKVFEQVLVPLHAGVLTVPPVEVSSFDPDRGAYVTKSTAPIAIDVAPGAALAAATTTPAPPPVLHAPDAPVAMASMRDVVLASAPAWLLVAAALAVRVASGARRRTSLRRAMRAAARRGNAREFFASAEHLVRTSLARAWGVPPDGVTPSAIRDRLGERGEPLASALAAGQTLRFGRGDIERAELGELCGTIEQSLRGAT